ncbi:MAG TPA: hypothetical protein VND94_13225 [Terriglobia bacterium]|nr:hypothetical protein [Terriglobia bacterium]
MIRRHHLIEEAKAELDLAYDAVKRAEKSVMDLEFTYNERMKDIPSGSPIFFELNGEKEAKQEHYMLDMLYDVQNQSAQRFAMVSASFAIVSSVNDEQMSVDLIRRIMFRDDFLRRHKVEIERAIREFHRGLRDYMRKESSETADQRVRQNWAKLEELTARQASEIAALAS